MFFKVYTAAITLLLLWAVYVASALHDRNTELSDTNDTLEKTLVESKKMLDKSKVAYEELMKKTCGKISWPRDSGENVNDIMLNIMENYSDRNRKAMRCAVLPYKVVCGDTTICPEDTCLKDPNYKCVVGE